VKLKILYSALTILLVISLCLCAELADETDLSELNLSNELSTNLMLKVKLTTGDSWIHKFKVMPLIKVKNRPQLAIWLENREEELLQTIMVTDRAANGNWRKAPGEKVGEEGIKRPSALPIWTSKRKEIENNDEDMNLVTCATPKKGLYLEESINMDFPFMIKLEVNHSTDFNDFYSRKATPGSPGYSNGKMGSGQPALVYGAEINREDIGKEIKLGLLGTSSPTGADGRLHHDLDNLTTAKNILAEITVILEMMEEK